MDFTHALSTLQVNTPVRSVVSSSSAPDGADRAVGEQLTAGDLSTGHREYQNQDPVRGPAEAREIPLDTQNASTKVCVISYSLTTTLSI